MPVTTGAALKRKRRDVEMALLSTPRSSCDDPSGSGASRAFSHSSDKHSPSSHLPGNAPPPPISITKTAKRSHTSVKETETALPGARLPARQAQHDGSEKAARVPMMNREINQQTLGTLFSPSPTVSSHTPLVNPYTKTDRACPLPPEGDRGEGPRSRRDRDARGVEFIDRGGEEGEGDPGSRRRLEKKDVSDTRQNVSVSASSTGADSAKRSLYTPRGRQQISGNSAQKPRWADLATLSPSAAAQLLSRANMGEKSDVRLNNRMERKLKAIIREGTCPGWDLKQNPSGLNETTPTSIQRSLQQARRVDDAKEHTCPTSQRYNEHPGRPCEDNTSPPKSPTPTPIQSTTASTAASEDPLLRTPEPTPLASLARLFKGPPTPI